MLSNIKRYEYKCGCFASGPDLPDVCGRHHKPVRTRVHPLTDDEHKERGLVNFDGYICDCDECWNSGRVGDKTNGKPCACGRRPWKYPGSGNWKAAARLYYKLRDLREDGELALTEDEDALRAIAIATVARSTRGFDVALAVLIAETQGKE